MTVAADIPATEPSPEVDPGLLAHGLDAPGAAALCELAGHVHAALSELASQAAAFDASRAWWGGGIHSCAHWLSINAGLDLHSASELLRVGHALARLPQLAGAFASGQLSLDEVRAVSRVATPADEAIWTELARQTSASQLSRICREYRRAQEADEPGRSQAQLARRGVWAQTEADGMLRLVARLAPEDGALVLAALETVAEKPAPHRRREGAEPVADPAEEAGDGWAARRADALVAVCEQALAEPEGLVAAPAARQVVVHVDVGVLTGEEPDGRCHLEAGPPLSAAVARRLGCDAELVAITEREGLPIDVGRARRLVSRRLRRALEARDRTCRFPGCRVPARRSHAHHLRHWALGGRTDLANLAAVCSFHHGRLHEGAYRIVRERGGGLRFETAEGAVIGPAARAVDAERAGAAHLRGLNRARGLRITGTTPVAGGGGERCDLDYAVSVMADACTLAKGGANATAAPARAGPS